MNRLVVALMGVLSVVIGGAALAASPAIEVAEPEAVGFLVAAAAAVVALRKFRARK